MRKKTDSTTGFSEMDSVLGGGIVPGSVVLLAGDPGIGKSTATFADGFKHQFEGKRCSVYFRRRIRTADKTSGSKAYQKSQKRVIIFSSLTNTDEIVQLIQETKPALVVIDSIQTMESENLTGLSGSVGQVRYAASQFIKAAKTLNVPTILVGHVTKEGMVAGPMILSHMVDTVLFLEGEKNTGTRILRSLKNRFGPVDEVGIFAMQEGGMEEIKNPEQIFLTK
jgi:DNA repair protein RadA/Sms